jgi:hypothetical protein
MYVQRQVTPFSLTEIARYWHKDHGTVMHAIDTVLDRMSTDHRLKAAIEHLVTGVQAKLAPCPLCYDPELSYIRRHANQ